MVKNNKSVFADITTEQSLQAFEVLATTGVDGYNQDLKFFALKGEDNNLYMGIENYLILDEDDYENHLYFDEHMSYEVNPGMMQLKQYEGEVSDFEFGGKFKSEAVDVLKENKLLMPSDDYEHFLGTIYDLDIGIDSPMVDRDGKEVVFESFPAKLSKEVEKAEVIHDLGNIVGIDSLRSRNDQMDLITDRVKDKFDLTNPDNKHSLTEMIVLDHAFGSKLDKMGLSGVRQYKQYMAFVEEPYTSDLAKVDSKAANSDIAIGADRLALINKLPNVPELEVARLNSQFVSSSTTGLHAAKLDKMKFDVKSMEALSNLDTVLKDKGVAKTVEWKLPKQMKQFNDYKQNLDTKESIKGGKPKEIKSKDIDDGLSL